MRNGRFMMPKSIHLLAAGILLLITGLTFIPVCQIQATVLLFKQTPADFANNGLLPQGYGNRVVATNQGGYLYLLEAGATPNIRIVHSTGGMPQIITWNGDFGDLMNVCMGAEPFLFQMKLVPDPGFLVQLHSFDMSCWPHLNYTINSVEIFGADTNQPLWAVTNVLILGSSSGSAQHTHFDVTNIVASEILVQFDARNVDSDDVGIDNITFSQISLLPTLDIARNGTEHVLSWNTNAAGFTLQSTLNLTPPATWMDSTNSPVVIGARFTVTNSSSASAQFYRLKKP